MKTKYIKVPVSERLPEEIWKDVVRFEEYYEVSNIGNVRSKDRNVISKDGRSLFFKGKNLKLSINSKGYYTICIKLRNLNLNKTKTVHRLVAEAFIENPNNFPVINHKDLNQLNNNIDNLEWCTQSHNIIHAVNNGRIIKNSFEYKNSQLNKKQVLEIRELIKAPNHKVKDIAKLYNVSVEIISKLKNGRTYNNI